MTYLNYYSQTSSTSTSTSTIIVTTSDGYRYEIPYQYQYENPVVYTNTTSASTYTSSTTNAYYVVPVVTVTARPVVYEVAAARVAAARPAEAEFRRQSDERRAQRERAIIEAEALLEACLDSVQRDELRISGWFIVTGSSGKRYRIRRGYAGNVEDFEGETIYTYCGHAYVDGMPEADQMLAQKFALETDEEGFRRIANASYLRPGTAEEREMERERERQSA